MKSPLIQQQRGRQANYRSHPSSLAQLLLLLNNRRSQNKRGAKTSPSVHLSLSVAHNADTLGLGYRPHPVGPVLLNRQIIFIPPRERKKRVSLSLLRWKSWADVHPSQALSPPINTNSLLFLDDAARGAAERAPSYVASCHLKTRALFIKSCDACSSLDLWRVVSGINPRAEIDAN